MLTDAALEGKIDRLNGLKENVIIGKLIPAATGLKRYRRIEIEPSEPLPARDRRRRAARPGRDRRRARPVGRRRASTAATARSSTPTSPRSRRSAPAGADPGFAEELAELEIPEEPARGVAAWRVRRGTPGSAVIAERILIEPRRDFAPGRVCSASGDDAERGITRRSLLAGGAGAGGRPGSLRPQAARIAAAVGARRARLGADAVRVGARIGALPAAARRWRSGGTPTCVGGRVGRRARRHRRAQLRVRGRDGRWSPWVSAARHGHGPDAAARRARQRGRAGVDRGARRACSCAPPGRSRACACSCVDVSAGRGARRAARLAGAARRARRRSRSRSRRSPRAPASRRSSPGAAWAQGIAAAAGRARLRRGADGASSTTPRTRTATPRREVPAMLRAIYAFHRYVNGWNDIGYNFVVDLLRAHLRGARGRHRRARRGRAGGRLQPRLDRGRGARLASRARRSRPPRGRRSSGCWPGSSRCTACRRAGGWPCGSTRPAPATATSRPARASRCRASPATATATRPTAPATRSTASSRRSARACAGWPGDRACRRSRCSLRARRAGAQPPRQRRLPARAAAQRR